MYLRIFLIGIIFTQLTCTPKEHERHIFILDNSLPLCTNCQSPNIYVVNPDYQLITYLKQIDNQSDALFFRSFINGLLSSPKEIARDSNWFVNWADVPSIANLDTKGEKLIAHWLAMSNEGTYDYDVTCSISNDSGKTWNPPFILHEDNVAAEHGFVTITNSKESTLVTWLDGRFTKTKTNAENHMPTQEDHSNHGHTGNLPMTLRAAFFDQYGVKSNDMEIDNRVCDCCQTDAVFTESGPVIVYRDRSDEEIRDIAIARYEDQSWSQQSLSKDQWNIAGCPVNGPAIAYRNGLLGVVWYTQINNVPKVFFALSHDDGRTFDKPLLIDDKNVMGRVDIVIDESSNVILSWMRSQDENAEVCSRVFNNKNQLLEIITLSKTLNQRKVGFPIMEINRNGLLVARTKSENDVLSIVLETYTY